MRSYTIEEKAKALWRGIQSRTKGYGADGKHYKNVGCHVSRKEFLDFIISNDKYIELFDKWKLEKFKSDFAPSVDRIDSLRGYSLDNIRIISWERNRARKAEGIMEKVVRMTAWITPKQKEKIRKIAKELKKKDRTVSESSIIRKLIDNAK